MTIRDIRSVLELPSVYLDDSSPCLEKKKKNQIQWRLDSMSSSPWFQQEHPGAGEISHFLRTAAPF